MSFDREPARYAPDATEVADVDCVCLDPLEAGLLRDRKRRQIVDCRELVVGSTLYLPITVDGALLHVGDGHAAQGDGEVGGTAIECGMTTELVVDLAADAPLDSIHAVTPVGRITFRFSSDLNEATGDALDAMLRWMQQLFNLDRPTALALASTTVDLRVTQVANQTWGVHAVLGHNAVERGSI
jgi:acetamidase/formamidase